MQRIESLLRAQGKNSVSLPLQVADPQQPRNCGPRSLKIVCLITIVFLILVVITLSVVLSQRKKCTDTYGKSTQSLTTSSSKIETKTTATSGIISFSTTSNTLQFTTPAQPWTTGIYPTTNWIQMSTTSQLTTRCPLPPINTTTSTPAGTQSTKRTTHCKCQLAFKFKS